MPTANASNGSVGWFVVTKDTITVCVCVVCVLMADEWVGRRVRPYYPPFYPQRSSHSLTITAHGSMSISTIAETLILLQYQKYPITETS